MCVAIAVFLVFAVVAILWSPSFLMAVIGIYVVAWVLSLFAKIGR
jgi:hypothetical protein